MVITQSQTCAYIVINYVDIFDNADMVSAVIEHAETTMTTLTLTVKFGNLSLTLMEQSRKKALGCVYISNSNILKMGDCMRQNLHGRIVVDFWDKQTAAGSTIS